MKFIICADMHLRPDVPRCRVQSQEEWIETQRSQLRFIANAADKRGVPIIICGDIFHTPQVPDYLKNMFIDYFFSQEVYAIAGQHDLPWHQWEKFDQSSFGTLWKSMVIKPISFGRKASYSVPITGEGDLLFLHTLIFSDQKSMPPNTKAMTAQEALDKYPDVKWIFAGDQHCGFHYTNKGRHVLVPGCMNTQSSDQNYKHNIYYIDTENYDNTDWFEIPDYGVEIVTDAYVQESKDKMDRIHSFTILIKEKMQQGKGSGIDFKANVRKAMENNTELTPGAIKIINQMMEK